MVLDYHSLLLALGVSAACLMVTLFGTWFSRRTDSFLLTLVVGLCLLIAGIFAYSIYTVEQGTLLVGAAYLFMMSGFSAVYAASRQFVTGGSPWRLAAVLTLAATLVGMPLYAVGLDGLALIVMNIGAGMLLIGTAQTYYGGREEAPGPLTGMAALYALSGMSFFLCAVVLIEGEQWVLGRAPENWAENLNIGVCIAGMTGIGALSLALHQWRLAARHRRDAMTDALTGLLNRRALFELHGTRRLNSSTAIVVFDIDHFKSINDQHGHATGDIVLKVFAKDLTVGRAGDHTAARLGGEEFALLVENAVPGRAERMANDIIRRFADREIVVGDVVVRCTVSAGVAVASGAGEPFEAVLNLADGALYAAKRSGRNRVEVAGHVRPVDLDGARTTA